MGGWGGGTTGQHKPTRPYESRVDGWEWYGEGEWMLEMGDVMEKGVMGRGT